MKQTEEAASYNTTRSSIAVSVHEVMQILLPIFRQNRHSMELSCQVDDELFLQRSPRKE